MQAKLTRNKQNPQLRNKKTGAIKKTRRWNYHSPRQGGPCI